MIRKSVGLALLALAVLAFVLTSVTGSTTAAFDPFNPIPYYAYLIVPSTGQHVITSDGAGIPAWLIPTLVGAGGAAIAYAVLRLRSRHR